MSLSVEPNPVPRSSQPGSVKVTWDSGDKAGGEVRVSRDGSTEVPFAASSRGSKDANWIAPGSTFEFRLYRPNGELVAVQAVRMEETPEGVGPRARRPGRPFIIASPNPVPLNAGAGTTRLKWDTGDGSIGFVAVATRRRAGRDEEALFASAPVGEREISWIRRDILYRFRLYKSPTHGKPLAETRVTMGFERREVLADVVVLAAVVMIPALILLAAAVLVRKMSRTISALVRQ